MKKKSSSQSAFFNLRVLFGLFIVLAGVFLALLGFGAFSNLFAQAQNPSGKQPGSKQPVVQGQYRGVMPVVNFDISPPLRDMIPLPAKECTKSENEEGGPIPLGPVGEVVPDKAIQRVLGQIGIPAPIISFDGHINLCGCAPPDPNGAVGPNHVVTMANLHFQVFNKTGTSLLGPLANNTLWSGFGGACQTQNAGDPVVLYDQLADRWLLSQFTSAPEPVTGLFYNCIAISTSPDPTGTYFRYAVNTGTNFPDYPKYGMWPDAYYISTREFASGTFVGVGAYALDRAQAIAGNPTPTVVGFLVPPGATPYNIGDGLLPSDLDGRRLPPPGSPNYFVGSMDNNGPYGAPQDALTLWKFHYDRCNPPASTFTLTNTLPTASFNSILALCGGTRNCIPQPGTANRIDHLGYRQRPLFRLAYRNFGTHESLVTNQSVSAGNGPNGEVSGVRWWELRSPNSSPIIFQEGTYAPGITDGIHRWMGSIAMNAAGDIALSYSASNGTNPSVFPSVFYTARHPADPPGQMTQGEASIINGTGSQTAGGNRWGDYTSIDVDPVNDYDFWVVNEYVPTTSASGWRLRIGAFNLGGPTPTPTVPPTPTPTPSPCGPTPTPTATPPPTPTPTPTPCPSQYLISQIGGSIVPGTLDINNHCDDCITMVTLPFPYSLYGQTFTAVNLSSNGNAQFTTTATDFTNVCLPWLAHNLTVFPYWDDLLTNGVGGGIFTSVSGSVPNRIFNIEWRTTYFSGGGSANFELRLYEGQSRFDVIYGTVTQGNTPATAGTQRDNAAFNQYFCNGSGGAATGGQSYTLIPCGTPTPTPPPTPTPTPTASPTPTATPIPTPTPRPRPTPGPSATPHGSPPPRP